MPYFNLVITMLSGGLWHGITWTFVVWGLLHGVALAFMRLWQNWHRGSRKTSHSWAQPLCILATYHFVCLTWIFFRANSLSGAFDLLGRILSFSGGLSNITAPLMAVLLFAAAIQCTPKKWYSRLMDAFAGSPSYVHAVALFLVAIVIQILSGHGSVPFVYSRF